MSSGAKKILDQALSLPDEDRRRIAEALLASISSATAEEIEAAWAAEARARAERLERGETVARDGDEVLAEIRAELQAKSQ